MRRRIALLALTALLMVPAFPARAAEPLPAPVADAGPPVVEPRASAPAAAAATAEPTSQPAAEAALASSAEPTPEPPAEPTPEPPASAAQPDAAAAPLDADGRYIVLLDPGVDPKRVRDRHARRRGLRTERVYERAVQGFAGELTRDQLRALRADPDVAAVVPDEVVEVAAQTLPTGVARIGAHAPTSSVARIDGVDDRVDADVAIVDTGIDRTHPDLNVVGGVNCSTSDRSLWRDVQGHGTHVAGTVAALDNASGVVGVAPGARLWAVKILNDEGFGYLSWYVCGLDWIAAQRDPADPSRPLIEAVNMSVAKWGRDDGTCGVASNDILHQAVCRVVKAGVTVVAAAANDAGSAALRVPAAYDEVITVSALADTDGKAGGAGGNRCWSWGTYDVDDTFADFSNYGADVDLIAPGKCIWSSLPGNRYGYSSGTSMAAPAVTGAVALYKASRSWATPLQVKSALQQLGSTNWDTSTDPDGKPERLLDVTRLGPAGDFPVALGTPASLSEIGGLVTLPITVARTVSHFEPLKLRATLPAAFTGALSTSTLSGFSATSATLAVTVPPSTPAGRYPVTVVADEGWRTRQATTEIVIENDAPTALPPVLSLASGAALATGTGPVRISWPAATDATSAIARYELGQSVDGAAWTTSSTLSGKTTSTVRQLAFGHSHRFRIRAQDVAGNWSEWVVSEPLHLRIVDDRSTAFRWSRGWSNASSAGAWQRTLSWTGTTGASTRIALTGRSYALVAPVGPTRGWFKIYVDGVYQGQVSLYAATAANARVVWAKTFNTDSKKVIELRAVRTAARPRALFDAIVVTR